MINEIKTKQGWRVIPVTLAQITQLGGFGICDACNCASGSFMYVAVLNSAYCQKCYDTWEADAKYYPEDVKIENKNVEYIKEVLR